jgi:vancomycin permeability regulator SanA
LTVAPTLRPVSAKLIRWRRARRLVIAGVLLVLLVSAPWIWTTAVATGHLHDVADAPAADVVIVLGTTVGAAGQPEARLAGRLQTAAELVRAGRARVVLVSGDGGGESGDEPAAMTAYLTGRLGIDPARVVADADGLDTYDSCARARVVYGLRRALVVTQSYHLSRAVTLCRSLGLDVEGVRAKCDGCGTALLARKAARDYFASGKAAWDAVRKRPPAVTSPPSLAIQAALARP